MKILYLADPKSIHDIKWMSYFSKTNSCFLLVREAHHKATLEDEYKSLKNQYNIQFAGSIEDFSIRNFGQTLKTKKRIKKIIDIHQIDTFHIMYAEPNALWAVFQKYFQLPILLTTRGTDILKTIPSFFDSIIPIKFLSAFFYKKALRKFEYIIGTSSRQLKMVERLSGRSGGLSIIRTGVNVAQINSNTSDYEVKILRDKKYVFFPRAMRPLYQHEFALSAIKQLPLEILEKYTFVFVDKESTDKEYTNRIQQLMDTNAAINFIWLKNLEQKALYETYKRASLVVMTPSSDGTPVSAVETMLCKTPLILPPLEYDQEIFQSGVCQFESWNSKSLTDLIRKILFKSVTPDLNLAYENAQKHGDREKEMNKLQSIYDLTLSSK